MHEILATAMFLGARKDRGVIFLPKLPFKSQKWHIQFHAFISRNKDFGIMVPGFYLKYAIFGFKISS